MDIALPQHIAERLRWLASPDRGAYEPGQFVLYWMHNALRAHENPALDAALCLARQNGLPLLVYHGLSEDYPYASDRLHAFMLQGHRDVQRELSDRGIVAAFHLQRQGRRGPYLRNLTRAAACLVTEEMPVQPLVGWLDRLVTTCRTPVATVDCSCVAPVTLLGQTCTSAAEFRRHAKPLYDARLNLPYPEQFVDVPMCDVDDLTASLGLEPICLQDVDLASLIGQCRIDHSVAPVTDTPGGSRAGYARWNHFKENGLEHYKQARNDPLADGSASRMSAYLHYGMVSPLRIAREASQRNAKKFLDELLTWRELAFHYCFHNRDIVDSLDALPDWAQESLRRHGDDPREADCSWETLARANTGRPLWDAAQRSLLKHGELHNNVRMTWGKAMLPWLESPHRALQLTLDLNHRYALDGRNPASYGGVLWCYGQFDRPFTPEQPVIGKIRPRCSDEHAQRIDLDAYRRHVDRPIAASLPRVAMIGAGIGGLAAARTLTDHGIDVVVFDKSRGVGGRTATRRATSPNGAGELRFDHGAQYFTARDARFCRLVSSWIHDGLVEPWMGRIVHLSNRGKLLGEKNDMPRYIGIPGMNAVAKHLANDLTVHLGNPITRLIKRSGQWLIENGDREVHGPFDVVLCNCPPPQTLGLIDGHTELAHDVRSVTMRPCWALMLADPSLPTAAFDGAFVDNSPIAWIARNDQKPGRTTPNTWVVHASADWSQAHVEDDPADVAAALQSALASLLGTTITRPEVATAHRWRYAVPARPLSQECLFDPTTGIGACGDWCGGSRVEAAYLSGIALAGTLLRRYTIDRTPITSAI
ncbi:Deoxyribodipyrimidine photo-lyase [Stieleria maiorica]|uniref:Deoxyribodipyrimidine photo-lyase n=1 Tax=Stieleria maiorica TaxID=2795974 RepID=A0A5B9MMC4_9BACT|nr:FAD-dependent oxidoreductase [Stieleria maiorica]QEG02552.1 Deoxyribodipyrimidine photo-lyase [Stieleria maiorica]